MNGALKAVGYALLVLFFLIGVMKTCGSIAEVKRPEHALKLFLRFILAKGVIDNGLEIMEVLIEVVQGILQTILGSHVISGATTIAPEMVTAIENCDFLNSIPLWIVAILGRLGVVVITFVLILTVYGRFFKIFTYIAIAPIPLSTFAGEPTQNVGRSFLKSFAGACLQGGNHCGGLCDFLPVRHLSAVCGCRRVCALHGMELYGGPDPQHADPDCHGESLGPCGAGNDGAVNC